MFRYRLLLLLCCLSLLLPVVSASNHISTAILVVDIFEADPESRPVLDGECVLAVAPQDSFKLEGGSIVSDFIPMSASHGQYVLSHVTDLLGNKQDAISLNSAFSMDIGGIRVEAINVAGKNWSQIVSDIADRINALYLNEDISNFVINMSFGIVPCDQMAEPTVEQYLQQLASWGITCQNGTTLSLLACQLEGFGDMSELLANYGSIEQPQAFAFLHMTVLHSLVNQALIAATPVQPDESDIQPLADITIAVDNPDIQIIQVASAGNQGLPYPYAPAIFPDVLSVGAEYSSGTCLPASHGDIYTYLNGEVGLPALAVDEIIHYFLAPLTNAAEVIAPGNSGITPDEYLLTSQLNGSDALGCLMGTSFAAPFISVQMAQYMVNGGTADCGGLVPPLATGIWSNPSYDDAKAQFCPALP